MCVGGGDLMVTSNKSNIEAVSKLNIIEPVLLDIESLETVYFSFSNFSELIREAAPLVLFGPSPYFMEGLEYKLVTITLSMVKGAENVK